MEDHRALSVSELNEYVRRLLAGDVLLRNLEVTGEISGYKHHYSGHRYFSLKDAGALVKCVMFRQNAIKLDFIPADGMQVTLRASASLYPSNGSFQLYVTSMRKRGVGELFERFEALKRKLEAEGLFDPAIKQTLPMTPSTIGIVTSRTGAAIRDMIRVARRRNPHIGIIVAPCAVQGTDAAQEIADAIKLLNRDQRAEVILCGRGGGSIEDLWAFNEETVARAIVESRIPVVSCVGHETDFSIADFVADVRAATPSMGAELAVPMISDLHRSLNTLFGRLSSGMKQSMRVRRAELKRVLASQQLQEPSKSMIHVRRREIALIMQRCIMAEMRRLTLARARFDKAQMGLRALNPNSVLERGFAYVTQAGAVRTRAAQLDRCTEIDIHMYDECVRAGIIPMHGLEDNDEKNEL